MTITLKTLVSLDGTDGACPDALLISDSAGDLFGTTAGGGANDDGTVFESSGAGFQGASANPAPPAGTTAYMILSDTSGDLEIYDIGGNTILGSQSGYLLGTVAPGWQVRGLGGFDSPAPTDTDMTDMMFRNGPTFGIFDISNNNITNPIPNPTGTATTPYTPVGAVGTAWTVAGFGEFSGNPGETDMLMQDPTGGSGINPGQFNLYDITSNAMTAIGPIGTVGLQWTVAGFGDFSSNPNETDMMLRATTGPDAGAFEVYDISNNAIMTSAPLAVTYPTGMASQWTVAGFSADPPTGSLH